jgi:Na+-translocating ferredoxin:NAD+ oxidoreductase subunit C
MARLTFRGGVHPPPEKSATRAIPVTEPPIPGTLIWPLESGPDVRYLPLVKKGDKVRLGEAVARTPDGHPLPASAGGTVLSVSPRTVHGARDVLSVVLRTTEPRDPSGIHPPVASADPSGRAPYPPEHALELSPESLLDRIRRAGVTDAVEGGGPLVRRLEAARRAGIRTVVVNAMESEPGLAADHRLLLERTEDAVLGIRLAMRILGARRAVFAVPAGDRGALKSLIHHLRRMRSVSVAALDPKYPSESEIALRAALGPGVPVPRTNSAGHGPHIQSVTATLAVTDAVLSGRPMIDRVVTVAGNGIAVPRNLRVRLGTPFSDCLSACGGIVTGPVLLLHGGPMRGRSQEDDASPVVDWTAGLTVLAAEGREPARETACIRCGRCFDCCPAGLAPFRIDALWRAGKKAAASAEGAASCIRCGSCSYICPAKRSLAESVDRARAAGLAARDGGSKGRASGADLIDAGAEA